MPRVLPTLLVVVLLGATVTAFAVAERLKLQPTPIGGTEIDQELAPTCGCPRNQARISFRLRRAGRVTVEVVDANERVVRVLARRVSARPGRLSFAWNGRDATGRLAPDGTYHARVHLGANDRTILVPTPIRLDTVRPVLTLEHLAPTTLSPDGDARNDVLRVRFRASERVRVVLLLDDRVLVRRRGQRPAGKLYWFGKVDGKRVAAGTYTVSLRGEDLAGNHAVPVNRRIRIRYVEVAPPALRVRANRRFAVRVRTDAATYRWRLGPRRGVGSGDRLVVRAPRPGRYTLYVEANGRRDGVRVVVLPAARRR